MQTLSKEEFKKKYGTVGLQQFQNAPKKGEGFLDRLKSSAKEGIGQIKAGAEQINNNRGINPFPILEGTLKAGAGAVNTLFSPVSAAIEPVVKPTLGKAVNFAADKISDSPTVQRFANSKAGVLASRVTEDINNFNTVAGAVVGSKTLTKLGGATRNAVTEAGASFNTAIRKSVSGEPLAMAKNVAKDVSPTYGSIINDQITRAFELTPGDLKNIGKSTGNSVGEFVAQHDLIGNTVDASKSLLSDFYKNNYNAVRTEIGKVKQVYSQSRVPRYTEALQELQKKLSDTPGLQRETAEVNALLRKKDIQLSDVQRVKELMDDHFSLYKATGDVSEGIAKQGLDNIRKDIRGFIENEVKTNSGVDIFDLNNKVATSRSILDAIESRAGKPVTRAQISLQDLGWFSGASVLGTPLAGIALVFAKKVLESPSIRLRIAKYVKGLSDAKKAQLKGELNAGKVPAELKQFEE